MATVARDDEQDDAALDGGRGLADAEPAGGEPQEDARDDGRDRVDEPGTDAGDGPRDGQLDRDALAGDLLLARVPAR